MDHTITLGDTSLFVRTEGTGSPILLVHGYPLDHHMWDAIVPALAEQHLVIAPDLRGFGQSTGWREVAPMERLADDLAALLDELDISEQLTFCGLSMGGYIGWQMWQRHRDRLARLVLLDTRAVADDETHARARRQSAQQVLAEGMEKIPAAMLPKLLAESTLRERPEIVTQLEAMIVRQDPRGVAAAQRGMAQRADASPWLPQITVPTLVICGEHDAISPPDEMRQLAAEIPGAQYVEIPAAGHLTPVENPEAVCQAMLPFCRDLD